MLNGAGSITWEKPSVARSSVIHTARVSQRASAEVMTVLARALD